MCRISNEDKWRFLDRVNWFPKTPIFLGGGLYRPQNETYYRAKRGLSGEIRISPADAFLGKKKAWNIRTSWRQEQLAEKLEGKTAASRCSRLQRAAKHGPVFRSENVQPPNVLMWQKSHYVTNVMKSCGRVFLMTFMEIRFCRSGPRIRNIFEECHKLGTDENNGQGPRLGTECHREVMFQCVIWQECSTNSLSRPG